MPECDTDLDSSVLHCRRNAANQASLFDSLYYTMLRGYRRTLLLFALFCLLLTLFELRHHWQGLQDTLSYSTRPLWDRPDGPTDVLPRLHEESLAADSVEACQRHGWTLRSPRPLLIDVVLFSTEVELLEIRLQELSDVVDIFVVVESTHDLMGRERVSRASNRLA